MKKYSHLFAISSIGLSLSLSTATLAHAQEAAPTFCYTFTKNLSEGKRISRADANALTIALSDAGVWTEEAPITAYDETVSEAVTAFQEKYADDILTPNGLTSGTGFVGAATRKKLNSLYSDCSVIADAPIETTSVTTPTPAPTPTPTPTATPSPLSDSMPNGTVGLVVDANLSAPSHFDRTTSVPIITFDLASKNNDAYIQGVNVRTSISGLSGYVTNAYLYQGDRQVASADVRRGFAQFANLTPFLMSANKAYPFTIKIDVLSSSKDVTVTASVSSFDITARNATNNNIAPVIGSATGSPVSIN